MIILHAFILLLSTGVQAFPNHCPLPSIYFTNLTSILCLPINGSTGLLNSEDPEILASSTGYIRTVEIDRVNSHVYWGDLFYHEIHKGLLDENKTELLFSYAVGVVQGLAVDWSSDIIYWTDSLMKVIELADTNGTHRKVLFKLEGGDEPRGIITEPENGYLFWTDWGSKPKIERSSLSGSHRKTIISSGIKWPNDLAIDGVTGRLYWIDAHLDVIESVDFDGGMRRLVFDLEYDSAHPYSMAYSHSLKASYWTDWLSNSIYFGSNSTLDSEPRLLYTNKQKYKRYKNIGQIRFLENQFYSASKPCSSSLNNCSHLCLKESKDTHACACPTGMTLMPPQNTMCAPVKKDYEIYFADSFAKSVSHLIKYVDKDGFSIKPLPIPSNLSLAYPLALDYDPYEKYIYWTDHLNKKTYRMHENGSNFRIVLHSKEKASLGIAVDKVNRVMYWFGGTGYKIMMSTLDGNFTRTVYKFHHTFGPLRSIAIHEEYGTIFFITYNCVGKISVDGMGEPRCAGQVKRNINPRGIAIDKVEERIYWCDQQSYSIQSVNLDLKDFRLIIQKSKFFEFIFWIQANEGYVVQPYSLSIHGEKMYWTDLHKRAIFRADKRGGSHIEYITGGLDHPRDLHVYSDKPAIEYKKVYKFSFFQNKFSGYGSRGCYSMPTCGTGRNYLRDPDKCPPGYRQTNYGIACENCTDAVGGNFKCPCNNWKTCGQRAYARVKGCHPRRPFMYFKVRECIQAVKPGVCSYKMLTMCPMNASSCLSDDDCSGEKKCCRASCGLRCSQPVKKEDSPCTVNNGGCSHFCVKKRDSYQCMCPYEMVISNVDGKTCMNKYELSKCWKEYKEATAPPRRIGQMIPRCKEDGTYEVMQCHGSTGHCWCVDTRTGVELVGSRKKPGEGRPSCEASTECIQITTGSVDRGTCCVFPFKYKGKTYTDCTTVDHDHKWCATTRNFDIDKKWGNCERESKQVCTTRTTDGNVAEGTCCLFPFTYNNKTYTECTALGHHRKWCATTRNYDADKKWGNCVIKIEIDVGEPCFLPKHVGSCHPIRPSVRWYYNKSLRRCEEFKWGGCDKNANQFVDQAECNAVCRDNPCLFNKGGCSHGCTYRKEEKMYECLCPYGMMIDTDGKTCVMKNETADECALPKHVGSCHSNHTISRWYFCEKSKTCKKFEYSSCGGNENNFGSKERCEHNCSGMCPLFHAYSIRCKEVDNRCNNDSECIGKKRCCSVPCGRGCHDPIAKPIPKCMQRTTNLSCRSSSDSWYFDTKSGTCKQIGEGRCIQTENKFRNQYECYKACSYLLCREEKSKGPCEMITQRWYYDKVLGKCQPFEWGGCKGNSNNFDSEKTCNFVCKRSGRSDPCHSYCVNGGSCTYAGKYGSSAQCICRTDWIGDTCNAYVGDIKVTLEFKRLRATINEKLSEDYFRKELAADFTTYCSDEGVECKFKDVKPRKRMRERRSSDPDIHFLPNDVIVLSYDDEDELITLTFVIRRPMDGNDKSVIGLLTRKSVERGLKSFGKSMSPYPGVSFFKLINPSKRWSRTESVLVKVIPCILPCIILLIALVYWFHRKRKSRARAQSDDQRADEVNGNAPVHCSFENQLYDDMYTPKVSLPPMPEPVEKEGSIQSFANPGYAVPTDDDVIGAAGNTIDKDVKKAPIDDWVQFTDSGEIISGPARKDPTFVDPYNIEGILNEPPPEYTSRAVTPTHAEYPNNIGPDGLPLYDHMSPQVDGSQYTDLLPHNTPQYTDHLPAPQYTEIVPQINHPQGNDVSRNTSEQSADASKSE